LVPSNQRKPITGARRRGRILNFDIESGGRWALIRRAPHSHEDARAAAIEHVARTLLQRYGVVFWRLLAREADWLPPWRDLLRVYRRLEARGEIRGGRFVAGFSGEQYALPEAIGLLRETRRRPTSEQWISLSGADPLNLIGVLTPGPRLAALTDNRLVYQDGLPVAILSAGKVQFLAALDAKSQWEAEKRLVRSAARGLLSHLS
jgi:ATP-dependent Lhr-like helicase